MMHETLKKLTDEDLVNICAGQPCYGVFDKNQNKIKYYIPRENDILITYNGTAVKKMCGSRQIHLCATCDEAELYAWSVAKNFHLFPKLFLKK